MGQIVALESYQAVPSVVQPDQLNRHSFDVSDTVANPSVRALKSAVQSGIRFAHGLVGQRALETRIALYFHQLEAEHWDEFRACVSYFKERSYRFVTPSEFLAASPSDHCLFLSFDDNFRSWHQALGILRDLAVTATFNVNTLPFRDVAPPAEVERYLRRLRHPLSRQTLSLEELKAIHAAGHTIGCHSHSHFVLSQLPRALWDEEIASSRHCLEGILGVPVTDFSWPYGMRGHFSSELRSYCSGIGFKTLANAIPGCQSIAGRDPLNIFRTGWRFDVPLEHNLTNLRINGRLYAALTGRSVIG